jgi:hypothetical protein
MLELLKTAGRSFEVVYVGCGRLGILRTGCGLDPVVRTITRSNPGVGAWLWSSMEAMTGVEPVFSASGPAPAHVGSFTNGEQKMGRLALTFADWHKQS